MENVPVDSHRAEDVFEICVTPDQTTMYKGESKIMCIPAFHLRLTLICLVPESSSMMIKIYFYEDSGAFMAYRHFPIKEYDS